MGSSSINFTAEKEEAHIPSDVAVDPKLSTVKKTPTDVKTLMFSNIRLVAFGLGSIAGLALGIILSPYFFSGLAVGIVALAIELAYRWHLSNKSTIAPSDNKAKVEIDNKTKNEAKMEKKPGNLDFPTGPNKPTTPENKPFTDDLNKEEHLPNTPKTTNTPSQTSPQKPPQIVPQKPPQIVPQTPPQMPPPVFPQKPPQIVPQTPPPENKPKNLACISALKDPTNPNNVRYHYGLEGPSEVDDFLDKWFVNKS